MKGIFFDLDGTMIYSMDFWEKINKIYLDTKGLEFKEELVQKLKVAPISETEPIFNEVYGDEYDFSDVNPFMDKLMNEQYSEFFDIKEGVLEKIKELKAKGFKMCITTATPSKHVIPLAKRLGFYEYMDYIFTPDILKVNKNELEFFKLALEKLGTKAENTYVFDDAIYSLKNARALGLIPVGVYDDSNSHETDEIKEIAKCYINKFEEIDVDKL